MSRGPSLLDELDLKEYEVTALKNLLHLGRTTAPNLAETTGIPKARIYGVLENLANKRYVKVIPGRPKEYQPKPPEEIVRHAKENARQEYEQNIETIESVQDSFLNEYEPLYEEASKDITPTEELFYVVDVGEPSESETRSLYHNAEQEVNVLTKGFEYFPSVEPVFRNAVDRGVNIRLLFVTPEYLTDKNRDIQSQRIDYIETEYPGVSWRYSKERLPWRGTLIDPSMDYESGKAILLVEEKDIPLHMRQAAITENASFVAGMNRYFDLIWEHDSRES